MGRPSKLTAATTAAICDVIAAGDTRTIAARAAGVHPDTLNGWLRRAAQEDTETPLENYQVSAYLRLGRPVGLVNADVAQVLVGALDDREVVCFLYSSCEEVPSWLRRQITSRRS